MSPRLKSIQIPDICCVWFYWPHMDFQFFPFRNLECWNRVISTCREAEESRCFLKKMAGKGDDCHSQWYWQIRTKKFIKSLKKKKVHILPPVSFWYSTENKNKKYKKSLKSLEQVPIAKLMPIGSAVADYEMLEMGGGGRGVKHEICDSTSFLWLFLQVGGRCHAPLSPPEFVLSRWRFHKNLGNRPTQMPNIKSDHHI